jgi:hypothetical protein
MTSSGTGVTNSLKRSAEEVATHYKSERKASTHHNLKDKLRTLKNGGINRMDTILSH